MGDWIWIAAATAAVLAFWVLGAYNRLVALRNTVADAWSQADEALRRRGEGTEALVSALRAPLVAELGSLDALWAAHAQAARAAGAMSARPLLAANAQAWAEAERHLGAAASRVFALAEGHGEAIRGDETLGAAVNAARAAWSEGEEHLRFARQLFNAAAAAYDEAIAIFPTSLLSRAFGFLAAGRL
jgi:LemA protein